MWWRLLLSRCPQSWNTGRSWCPCEQPPSTQRTLTLLSREARMGKSTLPHPSLLATMESESCCRCCSPFLLSDVPFYIYLSLSPMPLYVHLHVAWDSSDPCVWYCSHTCSHPMYLLQSCCSLKILQATSQSHAGLNLWLTHDVPLPCANKRRAPPLLSRFWSVAIPLQAEIFIFLSNAAIPVLVPHTTTPQPLVHQNYFLFCCTFPCHTSHVADSCYFGTVPIYALRFTTP
jgi:hypothetical protein